MRSVDAFDPDFRRLSYVRYADDFVVLVSGSSKDAGYLRNPTYRTVISDIVARPYGSFSRLVSRLIVLTVKWELSFLSLCIFSLDLMSGFILTTGDTVGSIKRMMSLACSR